MSNKQPWWKKGVRAFFSHAGSWLYHLLERARLALSRGARWVLSLLLRHWSVIIVAIAVVVLVVWVSDWCLMPSTSVQDRKDIVQLWAQVLVGTAVLFGVISVWQQLAEARREQAIARRALILAQEGQVTERFTRGVDQLGHEKPDVRVGGIYALERIARDSEKDHWTVMEVLTAYIREHAPWRESEKVEAEEQVPMVSTDVQAALTVIGRRKWTDKEGKDQILHLYPVDIRKAFLRGAHLKRAYL